MLLKIELHTPVRDKRPIFIAGSFNKWKADQEAYKLRPIGRDRHKLEIELPADTSFPLEYKYVRKGGWENVETDQFGNSRGNRVLKSPVDLVTDYVPRWQHNGKAHREQLLPKPIMIEEELMTIILRKKDILYFTFRMDRISLTNMRLSELGALPKRWRSLVSKAWATSS